MKRKISAAVCALCLTVTLGTVPAAGAAADKEAQLEKTKSESVWAEITTRTSVEDLAGKSQMQVIEKIGQMCQKDYERTGILASVSAAQCILESGYLTTELAVEANNCFGMKAVLSDNDWENSTWDGESSYTKETWEEYNGKVVNIDADFRSYESIEHSVADHSAYLLGAKDDDGLRYEGLSGETDYRKAIEIIKEGGYATDSKYVDKVCKIIEQYDLTRFDEVDASADREKEQKDKKETAPAKEQLYRVRTSWENAGSQIGAFASLDNAKRVCANGYRVYDAQGKEVYRK